MADRVSLQQFQTELARKLAESAGRPLGGGWLGVSWQGVRALLPLTQAGEIFNPTALQHLPHTQPWVLGVASLRGGLAVVLDWVRFLGLTPTVPMHPTELDTVYWVSLNPALGAGAALCVDHLLGLRQTQAWTRQAQAPTHAALRAVWLDETGQPWHELDLQALVQSPDFLDPRRPAFDLSHFA